jgi:hypothetical protein
MFSERRTGAETVQYGVQTLKDSVRGSAEVVPDQGLERRCLDERIFGVESVLVGAVIREGKATGLDALDLACQSEV